MAKVQTDDVVSRYYSGPDRRRGGLLGQARRLLIKTVRSKWLAMFAIAFAVSWAFHEVDEVGQHRIERQQRITLCTLSGVANAQQHLPKGERVVVKPILEGCEKLQGK